jgi:hypothetical protein
MSFFKGRHGYSKLEYRNTEACCGTSKDGSQRSNSYCNTKDIPKPSNDYYYKNVPHLIIFQAHRLLPLFWAP